MAIKVNKPLRHFVDLSLSFSPHPLTGDLPVLRDTRAINASLKNCIMIGLSEKPFNMEFGSQVLSMLFEMMDSSTMSILDELIRNAVYQEPRVELKNLFLDPNPETNEVKIEIEYMIVGYEETYIFTHLLTPTR